MFAECPPTSEERNSYAERQDVVAAARRCELLKAMTAVHERRDAKGSCCEQRLALGGQASLESRLQPPKTSLQDDSGDCSLSALAFALFRYLRES